MTAPSPTLIIALFLGMIVAATSAVWLATWIVTGILDVFATVSGVLL